MILGIDEVGRGPWAGPLVIGAVVLGGERIEGLTDSKKLTKKRRDALDVEIRQKAAGYGLGWVSASEIDSKGLSEGLRLATRRAVEQVAASYHEIIIDGTINFLADTSKGRYVTTMKKADLLVPSVSAASVIAKVARDNYMAAQDDVYPGYKFSGHVGYGTAAHREAIERLGVTPLHRLSFAPLAKYKSFDVNTSDQTVLHREVEDIIEHETTKKVGDRAEDEAAKYLVRHGHEITERNWRTRYCEIDIVSYKAGTLYFTEVKYRRQPNQGGGLVAVTQKKLNQMRYAAKLYAHNKKIVDVPMVVSAISLTGNSPSIEQYIESI
ncbi:ribonuclease HII [Candidatus Saccharibacteria bacterium]|nr:ribonuclease HII [Candidatus Saccharibacteria bacterium]